MNNKEELVELAKKNLKIAIKKKTFKFEKDLDYGIRWELYAERMRKKYHHSYHQKKYCTMRSQK